MNPNANKEIIKNTQNFLLKSAKLRRLEYEKILTDLNNPTSQESKLFEAYTLAEMQKDEKYYKEHFPKDTLLLESFLEIKSYEPNQINKKSISF